MKPWLDPDRHNPADDMDLVDPSDEARDAFAHSSYVYRAIGGSPKGNWGGKTAHDSRVDAFLFYTRRNWVIEAMRAEPIPMKRAAIWGWWCGDPRGNAAIWLRKNEGIKPDPEIRDDFISYTYNNPLRILGIYKPIFYRGATYGTPIG